MFSFHSNIDTTGASLPHGRAESHVKLKNIIVTQAEELGTLKSLDPNKNFDGVSPTLLKLVEIASTLSKLLNYSLVSSKCPSQWTLQI